jgi:hypothetical protein
VKWPVIYCADSLYGEGIAFYTVGKIIQYLVLDRTIHHLLCYSFQRLNKPIVCEYSTVQGRYSKYISYSVGRFGQRFRQRTDKE